MHLGQRVVLRKCEPGNVNQLELPIIRDIIIMGDVLPIKLQISNK